MKLNSFYDKKRPVSRKASSPMFVTNEVREQELMQEITVLEAQVKQYEESIIAVSYTHLTLPTKA